MIIKFFLLLINVLFAYLALIGGSPGWALLNVAAVVLLAIDLTFNFYEDANADADKSGSDDSL